MGRVTPRQAGVLALFFVTLLVPAGAAIAQNPGLLEQEHLLLQLPG